VWQKGGGITRRKEVKIRRSKSEGRGKAEIRNPRAEGREAEVFASGEDFGGGCDVAQRLECVPACRRFLTTRRVRKREQAPRTPNAGARFGAFGLRRGWLAFSERLPCSKAGASSTRSKRWRDIRGPWPAARLHGGFGAPSALESGSKLHALQALARRSEPCYKEPAWTITCRRERPAFPSNQS
jgi:hypothetical protein